MHNLIAGESVSRISRQSGHAHSASALDALTASAWNRTLSIGLRPAGVYSVFAKACSQVIYASSWALKSHHTTPESTLLTIFSISFRFVSFHFVSFRSGFYH